MSSSSLKSQEFPEIQTDLTYFRGRVALAAILEAVGVRAGDQVALQAFTCIAVPEAILACRALPVYVDTEPNGCNMDEKSLAAVLVHKPTIKAVIVQHTFGLPARIRQLKEVADARGIPVIEDCAHTIASSVDGRPVGTWGVAGFFSHEASKPLFTGLGGSIASADPEMLRKLREARSRFTPPGRLLQAQIDAMRLAGEILYRPSTYWAVRSLYRSLVKLRILKGNYNELEAEFEPSAEFGREMGKRQRRILEREIRALPRQTAHRERVAEGYRAGISNPRIRHPSIAPGVRAVFGRYPLYVQEKKRMVEAAMEARIELADFYATPVHPLKGADLDKVAYVPGSCPNAEQAMRTVVSLPTGARVSEKSVAHAVEFFNRWQ